MSPARVAFVRVHDLALASLLRVEPELALQALAVLDVAPDLARGGALPPGGGAAGGSGAHLLQAGEQGGGGAGGGGG